MLAFATTYRPFPWRLEAARRWIDRILARLSPRAGLNTPTGVRTLLLANLTPVSRPIPRKQIPSASVLWTWPQTAGDPPRESGSS